MRMVPCSTFAAQPASSREVTITPPLPGVSPTDERIAGQAPASPSIWNVSVPPCARGANTSPAVANRSALTSERIPHPHPYFGIVGSPRIIFVEQIRAAQETDREQH